MFIAAVKQKSRLPPAAESEPSRAGGMCTALSRIPGSHSPAGKGFLVRDTLIDFLHGSVIGWVDLKRSRPRQGRQGRQGRQWLAVHRSKLG